MNIQSALAQLFTGTSLTQSDAKSVFLEVMSGNTTPAQIGALLAALRVKGETPAEIAVCIMAEIVNVMRNGPATSLREQIREERRQRRDRVAEWLKTLFE